MGCSPHLLLQEWVRLLPGVELVFELQSGKTKPIA